MKMKINYLFIVLFLFFLLLFFLVSVKFNALYSLETRKNVSLNNAFVYFLQSGRGLGGCGVRRVSIIKWLEFFRNVLFSGANILRHFGGFLFLLYIFTLNSLKKQKNAQELSSKNFCHKIWIKFQFYCYPFDLFPFLFHFFGSFDSFGVLLKCFGVLMTIFRQRFNFFRDFWSFHYFLSFFSIFSFRFLPIFCSSFVYFSIFDRDFN